MPSTCRIHKDVLRRLQIVISTKMTNRRVDRFTDLARIDINTHFWQMQLIRATHLWHSHLDIYLIFQWKRKCIARTLSKTSLTCSELTCDRQMRLHSIHQYAFVIYSLMSEWIHRCWRCAVEDENDEDGGDKMEEGEISMQLREHDDTLMAFQNLRWLIRIRYAIINNKKTL